MSEKPSRNRVEVEDEELPETAPAEGDKLVKIELRLPDASRHEIEFPASMTAWQLTELLAQHFNLDKYHWNLLLGSDSGTTYLEGKEVLSDLIVKSNNAYLYFYPQIFGG
jgi:hypothetical protein